MDNHEFKNLKGLHVLVVNDNSIDQRLISHMLMQWQVSADMATNGKTALEMVTKDIYDVVLMDIIMPAMDEYETTRAIRSMEGTYFRKLPIFVLNKIPDNKKMLEYGITGYYTGFHLPTQELYQMISPYLKQIGDL